MTLDKTLSHFKTNVVGLAHILGISQPAVSNWRRRGSIPELQQLRIEKLSEGKLKVDKKVKPASQR
jgi:predicted transcriptional regulator